MREEKGGPGSRGPNSRMRKEQFSDPMAWSPEMRSETGPPRISRADEAAARREKEINAKILADQQNSWLEVLKPLVGILLLGIVIFSQLYRRDPANAVVLTGVIMLVLVCLYLVAAKNSLPPIVSLLAKLVVGLAAAGIAFYFVASGSDLFNSSEKSNPIQSHIRDAKDADTK